VRRPRLPAGPVDAAIAGFLFAVGVLEAVGMDDLRGPLWANIALLAVLCGPLAWRRRRPLAVATAVLVGATLQGALVTDATQFGSTFAVLLLAAYSVGAYAEDRPALLGLGELLVTVVIVDLIASEPTGVGDYVFPSALTICSWLAGRAVRHRSRLAEALHELALRAEEDREAHRQGRRRRRAP
jgi:hypothetical protein